jgi:hypothetical protein
MGKKVAEIGTQLQLFLDDWLIESMPGLALQLQEPVRKEMVLTADRPYETPTMYDPTVIKDGDRYRLWYRANLDERPFYTGYAESPDGIHWAKPSLGLIEFQGSKDNNLVWPTPGDGAYVLSVFKDGNPCCREDERYKAMAIEVGCKAMVGLVSPDGLRWKRVQQMPIIPGPVEEPHFDSYNIMFWDEARGYYVAYLRGWRQPVRRIRRGVSTDFIHWSRLEHLDLGDTPDEHLYKNAGQPYYRRPDIYLMFPKRFMPDRQVNPEMKEPGLSDIVFMFSRDGLHFDRRFMEAFVRPGRDLKNWRDRAIEVGPNVVPTGPGEMSFYLFENYQWPSIYLRRMALREDGFVSVHADYAGGEFVTRPLVLAGQELTLNYATSAAGSIRVEVQDAAGNAIPGFTLAEAPEIYGDELERVVSWTHGAALGALAGQTIRLRVVMKDGDLYSLRFRN